jgi:hypothetical protein
MILRVLFIIHINIYLFKIGEAKEINKLNKCITYGYPMHQIREFGIHNKVFDLLDERKLDINQLSQFISLLYINYTGIIIIIKNHLGLTTTRIVFQIKLMNIYHLLIV